MIMDGDLERVSFLDDVRADSEVVERIAAFLLANNCVVDREVLEIRFADVDNLDAILDDMVDRGVITTVTTASDNEIIVLTYVPSNKCTGVTVTVTFTNDLGTCGEVTLSKMLSLSPESMEELAEDVMQVLSDWDDSEDN